MTGVGMNPRYGWDTNPNRTIGEAVGYTYAWPPYNCFFPAPPPGYGWYDLGSVTAAPPPAYPSGTPSSEPGYEYVFPAHHCKIHVLQSATPPWLGAGPFNKKCFNVPTNITIKELMQQFGCTNKDPARNKLIELTQGADGTWYKGIEISGSDEKKMAKMIEEVGWNAKRNGVDGDFVWLYFVKQ